MPPKRKKMTRAEFMRMKQRMEATSGRAKKKKGRGKGMGGSGADKALFQQKISKGHSDSYCKKRWTFKYVN